MSCKRDRFGSRFVVSVSVILGCWLAAGVVHAPAQEGLSHAEDPALSPHLKRIDQDKLLLMELDPVAVVGNRDAGSALNALRQVFTMRPRPSSDSI